MREATAVVGFDTYPHVDMAERGREAGRIIARTVRGEIGPVTAIEQIPMFWGLRRQVTAHPPMNAVLDRLHEVERRPGILAASVATGFAGALLERGVEDRGRRRFQRGQQVGYSLAASYVR